MYNYELINFRLLGIQDLNYMYKWLNNGFAQQWYGKKEFTMRDIEKKYIPCIKNEKPTQAYLILYNDTPIGYVQTYKILDYQEYAQSININENAAGLDIFIGEQDYIHKGLGKYIIKKFLDEIVFKLSDSDSCILGPEPDNIVAIKTYEKVGFKYIKSVETEDGIEYLMRIGRNDVQKL